MAKKKESKAAETPAVAAKPTDVETEMLLGPVKEIMLTTYKGHLMDNMIIKGKILIDYSGHNTNSILTFDEKGHKIKKQSFSTRGHSVYLYNENGKEYEHTEFIKNVLERTTLTTFTKAGNPKEVVSRNADGSLHYRVVHEYNADGREVSQLHYYGVEDVVNSRVVREYNELGNQIVCLQYQKDDFLHHQTHAKFNEQGKELETISESFDVSGKHEGTRTIHELSKQGDCIQTTVNNLDGSLKYSYSYTHEYDNDGKLIVPYREPYNPDPLAAGEREELENDSHNNWIKKTRMYNKLPVNIKVREISYFDDESISKSPFTHAITTAPVEKMEEKKDRMEDDDDENYRHKLSNEDAKWLVDGAQTSAENFQPLRYYAITFKEAPSVVNFHGPFIEPFALYEELKDNMGSEEIHSYCTVYNGRRESYARYSLSFPQEGYILTANNFGGQNRYDYEIPGSISKHVHDYVYTSQIQLLRPSIKSGKRDDFFERQLSRYIDYCTYTKKPDQPTINMIEVSNNNFAMIEHDVDDSFEIRDLDVNYGYGFEKFHKELMGRFNTGTKGLVLFHGLPGTGKTYYIRHLLREMANGNKEVIYMPPNMVDHLTEPAFMTFLSGEIREWSSEGKYCVLLIEDAEPLLAKRQEGVRIQGVTNLLNMTDGLLNDMLNLQIICTFNVDLKKLDSALLRPGRLIARKEFKALNELDANLLAQRLGIKHHFKKPATLGEIYSFGKNMSTLIHDVEAERDASTNIDDL